MKAVKLKTRPISLSVPRTFDVFSKTFFNFLRTYLPFYVVQTPSLLIYNDLMTRKSELDNQFTLESVLQSCKKPL